MLIVRVLRDDDSLRKIPGESAGLFPGDPGDEGLCIGRLVGDRDASLSAWNDGLLLSRLCVLSINDFRLDSDRTSPGDQLFSSFILAMISCGLLKVMPISGLLLRDIC